MIRIVLSTDANGFSRNATVLGSVLRRTRERVFAKIYTRGFEVPSFQSGRLTVEFRRSDGPVTGRYPGHVSEAVFDRLRIIADEEEWDRVLVMDHDMIALCDLAPYFAEDFEGNLLMGRLFGAGNTLGLQMQRRGGLPDHLKHCNDYPYFFMGPMMNLAAMREEGLWERLLEVHSAIGQDEQISLTAACGGRAKGVDKKWNLVPQWDDLEKRSERLADERAHDPGDGDVRWLRGTPQGIIHWTGWHKPWNRNSKVWRSDLWEAERTSWDVLREGRWEKPRALEIGSQDLEFARGLFVRGWKVSVVPAGPFLIDSPPTPDIEVEEDAGIALGGSRIAGAELLRFGATANPLDWLDRRDPMPETLVLQGPRTAVEIEGLRNAGYVAEARIDRRQWPAGGPHPMVLHYREAGEIRALGSHQDLYVARQPTPDEAPIPSGWGNSEGEEESLLSEDLKEFLERGLADILPAQASVLVLGSNRAAVLLAGAFPESKVVAIHHDASRNESDRKHYAGRESPTFVDAAIDPTLPWYDLGSFDPIPVDLLFVGVAGEGGTDLRTGAPSIAQWLNPGAIVVIEKRDVEMEQPLESPWSGSGFIPWESGPGFDSFKANEHRQFRANFGPFRELADLADHGWLISADQSAMESQLSRARAETGINFKGTLAESPDPSGIPWSEMKGLEAHGHAENLRRDYVIDAIALKRALIRVLREFIRTGDSTALVVQGRCIWDRDATRLVRNASRELPPTWDMLYFNVSTRNRHIPFSPHLVKLKSARGSLAVLWKREAAIRLLPGLEACDCEWEVFVQEQHKDLEAFCVMPMPAGTMWAW